MRKNEKVRSGLVVFVLAIGTQAIAQSSHSTFADIQEAKHSRLLDPLLGKSRLSASESINISPKGAVSDVPVNPFSGTFDIFDAPAGSSLNTYGALFIDPEGRVIGSLFGPNGLTGFVRQVNGQLALIAIPGAVATYPAASNDAGVITGWYGDANGVGHGFVLSPNIEGRSYDLAHVVTIDCPQAPPDSLNPGTYPVSINNVGEITGVYYDVNGSNHAFLIGKDRMGKYQAKNAVTFDVPGASTGLFEGTNPTKVNDFGVIAGTFQDGASNTHGFIRDTVGSITEFDVPTSGGLYPYSSVAMNNREQVTGTYFEPITGNPFGGNYRGFIRGNTGDFQTFDEATYSPCCIWTFSTSINSTGQTAGYDNDGHSTYHAFFRDRDGRLARFDAPNASTKHNQGTQALAINDAGVIAGYFTDINGGVHGFVRRAASFLH